MKTAILKILGNGAAEHIWSDSREVRSDVPARKEPYSRVAVLEVDLPSGTYEIRRHVEYDCPFTSYQSKVAFDTFVVDKKE